MLVQKQQSQNNLSFESQSSQSQTFNRFRSFQQLMSSINSISLPRYACTTAAKTVQSKFRESKLTKPNVQPISVISAVNKLNQLDFSVKICLRNSSKDSTI